MANSTTNIDLVSVSQSQKEATVNAALDAASPAMLYGRRASTTGGLVWGYYGGMVMISGTPTQIANGTLTLAASTTCYVEADPDTGAVSSNTTGFTAGRIPLYQVVTGASTVTSYQDVRIGVLSGNGVTSVNGHTGAVTLTASDVGADASGAASSAVAAHEGESDPHPQYLTQSEGDARYAATSAAGVTSVNSKTGAVTLAAADVGAVSTSSVGAAGGVASLGGDGKVPASQLPATSANGTVTSVDLSVPGLLYTVSGNPVTTSGTLAFTLKTQTKNTFLAGPASGADATPTMRAITQADLPAQPFDVTAFYPGVLTASAIVTRVPVARAVTFPSSLSGSIAKASVAATASSAFDVQKNGSSVGTITFAAGATSATFTATSAITFAAGDVLAIVGPATADATLANVGIVLAGTR